jgi:hypothetical protein
MTAETLFTEALRLPSDAIAYFVSHELADLFPGQGILEADACPFGVERYAHEGLCVLEPSPRIHNRIETQWQGTGKGLTANADAGWYAAEWQGHRLEVLLLSWQEGFHKRGRCWVVADARETAETFYLDVCEWNAEVRGEVLVFEDGGWHKSQELFQAIEGTTFESLILPEALKSEVQSDLSRFFAARATYERYGIPWKRGVLLLGTPGNGKTHTVKALINQSRQPCLYVKSFKSEYATDHDNIRKVFQRARETTPCLLVLEDLDSLIDGSNRAFFLNEMDGFAANTGIVTLATTNHPERLDPAILDRPSRFDRKYHFDLPGPDERQAFLTRWNGAAEPAMRLSADALLEAVTRTDGYSFAYLKELWLSATMRWISTPEPGAMDGVLTSQIDILRSQMQAEPGDDGAEIQVDGDSGLVGLTTMMQAMRGRRPRRM